MTASVRFTTPTGSFDAVFHDNPVAGAILKALPLTSTGQRWGDEIYFDIPVRTASTAPTTTVRVGDIAYWPDGPCLCVFFGKTPASKADEPRPASDVTIVGHTDAPVALLRSLMEGAAITVAASEA